MEELAGIFYAIIAAIPNNEVICMAAGEFLLVLLGLVYFVCWLYAKFDHSGWNEQNNPYENARITEETIGKLNFLMTKRYRDMQGGNYYTRKITFTFSDGFWYTSYKLILPSDLQNIPPNPFSPEWSKLRQKAINAHSKAVRKKTSRRTHTNINTKKLLVRAVVTVIVVLAVYILMRPVIFAYLGNAAVKRGEYEKGIELLQKAQGWESAQKDLYDAWLKFADHEADEVKANKEDSNAAGARGQKLRALDAQLRYCHALHTMSYDLSKVYPSGVVVDGAALDGYHITKLGTESQDRLVDASSILVFRREQLGIPRDTDSETDEPPAVKYAVRLLPGSMFVLDGDFAAKSFSEAKCIIIMDSVYVETGAFIESSIPSGKEVYTMDMKEYASRIKTRRLPYYAAVDALTAYSKAKPSSGVVLLSNINQPVCANEDWQKQHTGIDRYYSINDYYRIGKFDTSIKVERLAPIIMLFLLEAM